MRTTALLVCLAATKLFAQDYFPLHTGNQWIYRTMLGIRATLTTVEVSGTETFGNQTYAVVTGFEEGTALLRMAEDGTLYRYNSDSKSEEVWVAFATREGETYQTAINPCNKTVRVESRAAKTTVPAGEFINALAIRYLPTNCADAGFETEFYAPYIGLVERTSFTIAGPRKTQLIYARVGGVTVLSAPEVSFTVAVDKSVYAAGENALVRMAVRNTSAEPLSLFFPSGQRFDIAIRNQAGVEVYRWSASRVFIQVAGTETLAVGERNYAETIALANGAGQPLAAGSYRLEAWLATSPARYAGTVAFDIR
jgi:Intracellular proteinase inhibitor